MPLSAQAKERPGSSKSRIGDAFRKINDDTSLYREDGSGAKNRAAFHFSYRNPPLHFVVRIVDEAPVPRSEVQGSRPSTTRAPGWRKLSMRDLELMLKDYRLTTAEILYHLPDHPSLLQTYVWQGLDISPRFPALHKFLQFWESSLDGRLHSVKVASAKIIKPNRFRYARALLNLH
jgi:uncharacterized protein Usg